MDIGGTFVLSGMISKRMIACIAVRFPFPVIIRDDTADTPRQTPWMVPVVYARRFPRLAYIHDDIGFTRFALYAVAGLLAGIICLGIFVALTYTTG